MSSKLRSDWVNAWQPLTGGFTHRGLASGWILTAGWFTVRVRGGSFLYRGLDRAAIDFARPVGAASADAREIQLFEWIEAEAGTRWYSVRRVSPVGVEGPASAATGLAIDESGRVVGGLPGDVERAWGQPLAGGRIQVLWRYSPTCEARPPSEFRIYQGSGPGPVDYSAPVAVVPCDVRLAAYSWTSNPYEDGQAVRFGVRAANGAGEGGAAEGAVVADAVAAACEAIMTISEVGHAG